MLRTDIIIADAVALVTGGVVFYIRGLGNIEFPESTKSLKAAREAGFKNTLSSAAKAIPLQHALLTLTLSSCSAAVASTVVNKML